MLRPLLFSLLLAGSAHASCLIEAPQLQLPTYSALSEGTGTLRIAVRCETPQDRATVFLTDTVMSVSGDDLTLSLRGDQDALQLTVVGAGSLRGGLAVEGSQTLLFRLITPRDQWIRRGSYSLPATLRLEQSPA